MAKTIDIHFAHFRWGWEPSLDNFQRVRYHVVSCDYDRIAAEAKMHKFEEQISKISPITVIRQPRTGKVKNSELHFVFQSFDSSVSPSEINLRELGKHIIKDYRLCERFGKFRDIEDYVSKIYEH